MGANLLGKVTTYADIVRNRNRRLCEGKEICTPELPKEKLDAVQEYFKVDNSKYDVDEDIPLPEGYTKRASRKIEFLSSDTASGLEGLAWAILLTAVADGCNPKWLEEIATYYQVSADRELLYRHPVSKGVSKNNAGEFIRSNDLTTKVRRVRVATKLLKDVDIPANVIKTFITHHIK